MRRVLEGVALVLIAGAMVNMLWGPFNNTAWVVVMFVGVVLLIGSTYE